MPHSFGISPFGSYFRYSTNHGAAMKQFYSFLLSSLVMALFMVSFAFAQTGVTADYAANTKKEKLQAETKEALDKLMRFAEARNYDGFGKMMIYSGRDPNRTMRVKMNPRDAHEKLEIENTLNYVKHWLDKSALYHAKTFRVVKGLESDLYFWDVEFTTLKGKAKMFRVSFCELDRKLMFIRMEKMRS